jgi:hypothetical protein
VINFCKLGKETIQKLKNYHQLCIKNDEEICKKLVARACANQKKLVPYQ